MTPFKLEEQQQWQQYLIYDEGVAPPESLFEWPRLLCFHGSCHISPIQRSAVLATHGQSLTHADKHRGILNRFMFVCVCVCVCGSEWTGLTV